MAYSQAAIVAGSAVEALLLLTKRLVAEHAYDAKAVNAGAERPGGSRGSRLSGVAVR